MGVSFSEAVESEVVNCRRYLEEQWFSRTVSHKRVRETLRVASMEFGVAACAPHYPGMFLGSLLLETRPWDF